MVFDIGKWRRLLWPSHRLARLIARLAPELPDAFSRKSVFSLECGDLSPLSPSRSDLLRTELPPWKLKKWVGHLKSANK